MSVSGSVDKTLPIGGGGGNSAINNLSTKSSQSAVIPINFKTYLCPGCSTFYDTTRKGAAFVGRNPLVLNCKHTICEECIKKTLIRNSKIVCGVCQELCDVYGILRDGKVQSLFPFNYYLMGLILCTKSMSEGGPMTLSSTGFTLKRKPLISDIMTDVTDHCCIVSCRRIATVKCVDCDDFYCSECSINVHKSVPFLGSHKTEPITNSKFSVELEKCSEHNGMDIEFYCKNCETGACCYCFLDKHEGHERQLMSKLNDAEVLELNVCKDNAVKILRQLLITQKKVRQMQTYDTSELETKISGYFADLHARLYLIEKKLHNDLANINTNTQDWGMISSSLSSNINLVKNLINTIDSASAKKYNMRSLLAKLKECEEIPCFLINKASKEGSDSFFVDPILDNLEDYFALNHSVDNGYVLVSSHKLPSDYKYEVMDASAESDTDSDISKLLGNSRSDIPCKLSTENIPEEGNSSETNSCSSDRSNEEVLVTHIDTVENFYVQRKSLQTQFCYLIKDIRNYLRHARQVTNPKNNDLYLVEYVTRSSKEWCRGRVISVIRPNFYKIFLIDYGNTIEASKDKLYTINTYLAQKRPFAILCKLHNPSNSEWSEDAHLHMARIISRKETHMSIKHASKSINEVKLQVKSPSGTMTSVAEMLIMTCENTLFDRDEFGLADTKNKVQPISTCKLFENSKRFILNDSVNVVLTYIRDPHNIFVQIGSYREDYHKMLKLLRTHFKSLSSCVPVKGTFVIVQHKLLIHGDFHRAEVLDVDTLNKLCHVFLVDLGCDLHVPWINIRFLSQTFAKLECQAIKIKLAHVEPNGREWPNTILLDFQKYIISEQVLKMVVENTDPLEVALFEIQPNVDFCINAILVKKNQAKSTGSLSKTVEWPQIEKTKEEDPGFMFVKQTQLASLEGSDDDNDADDTENGIKQPVDVVRVESPHLIYIKFHLNHDKEKQLYEELQVHYTNEREYKDSWKIGEKCVVSDPQDNDYCRAIITERVDGKYKVYLNDKGIERIVSKECVFLLNSYFNKYHDMVFKCHLANIEPAGDTKAWSKMAIEYLQHVLKNNKNIYVRKVKKAANESIPVEMWYSKLVSGTALEPSHTLFKSINKMLINAGLALRKRFEASSPCEASQQLEIQNSGFEKDKTDVEITVLEEPERDIAEELTDHKILTSEKNGGNSCKKQSDNEKIDWNDLIEAENQEKLNEVTDWQPPFKFNVNQFQAVITCADYEGILYLHDTALDPLYKDMEQKLKEWFDNLPSDKSKHTWFPGQMCTIHYEDYWYRGTVVDTKDNGLINVFMIDFGSDHDCKMSQLSPKVMYTDIPAFASKVKLHHVYAKDGSWSEEDYKCLLENVTDVGRVVIREGSSSDVPLVDIFTEDGVCLNDLLVKKASNLTRRLNSGFDSSTESLDDIKIESENDTDYLKVETEGYIMLKEESELPLSISYKLAKIPDPDESGKLKMRVVNIIDFNKIILDVLGDSVEYSDLFECMKDDIQETYESQPALKNIELGMPCLSHFIEDGNWYRAQIFNTDSLSLGHVIVFYVDYGNFDSVACSALKEIKQSWLELPVRNQLCQIAVQLTDDDYKSIALEHITQLEGRTVPVEVISKDPLTVHIYEEFVSDLHYQELLENGVLLPQ